MAFDNNVLFNMPNDYSYPGILTKTFVPNEQFDREIIMMVTEDQTTFKIAILKGGTKL